MTDQNTFTEVLREVAKIIRTSESPMSEEEIMAYFDDMDLSFGQKKLVLEYLNNMDDEYDNGSTDNSMEDDNGETGIDEASKNSKVLKAYMEDLSLLQTYSEKEIMELYKRLFSGESEVIETISTVWLRKVLGIAEKYMDIHSKVEDLIQEGNMALLMRLNQLCGTPDCSDAEREFSEIEADLYKVIEKGIMDYISEWDSTKQQENTLVGKLSLVHEAEIFLTEENGAPPTLKQLSGFTKMPEDELLLLKEFTSKLQEVKPRGED